MAHGPRRPAYHLPFCFVCQAARAGQLIICLSDLYGAQPKRASLSFAFMPKLQHSGPAPCENAPWVGERLSILSRMVAHAVTLTPAGPMKTAKCACAAYKIYIRGIWMKYCTVAKTMGRDKPTCVEVNSSARPRRLCSAAGSINSGCLFLNSGPPFLDVTLCRRLRKRRVFDLVPSYLNLTCFVSALSNSFFHSLSTLRH